MIESWTIFALWKDSSSSMELIVYKIGEKNERCKFELQICKEITNNNFFDIEG